MAARNRESYVLHHRESMPQMQVNGGSISKDVGTSVQVALRIRPLNAHDQVSIPARWQRQVVQPVSSNAILVDASGQAPPGATALAPGANKRQTFTFDRVLGPSDGQEQVYNNSVMPLIGRFLEGYNVTILAYGQTSSGKSYTMGTALGDADFESLVAGQRPDPSIGIIPRSVAQIFSEMKSNPGVKNGTVQYSAKASFIEIYNEELIDLLADGEGDARPLVQIREDKAGHIIWSGLKEVRVQNVADVMNRLLQGSTIRRTNETDMNAQSSRSHAIFSLTLVQRKYVGSGAPPVMGGTSGIRPPSSFGMRSQTPNGGRTTPTGRSSGLPRPASTAIPGSFKLGSPSRSGTPASGNNFAFRPSSVASVSGRASPMPEERSGSEGAEWVTVTSKFHFVDLAGSERLKRTAAQGERVKEGISINAGLHALGNVISALGDPAKSKRTTHIPYRDSKLTRLLQDSLGGNAHTLMIACVSPTEYNVSETVNTLQYANRARNIKNKAELNEVEIGWDDIDYLQGQVTKLRKELQLLKGFKTGTPGNDAAIRVVNQKEVLEWQAKYATLSQKFSHLTAEATRLQQQASRESLSQDDYYQAAEPVIIEYEKTVDALEGQINLQKAALGHCEDVILEHESMAKEQGARLEEMERELEIREHTVVELQARLTKLEDREATADSYARDLESRLAAQAANGMAEAGIVAELRRETSKLRETGGQTEQYVRDLEARLTASDEGIASLRSHVARLEKEVSRRDEAYKEAQQRMSMMDKSSEQKALVEELDARDASLLALQAKMDSLQAERDEIARERGRLTNEAATKQLERGKLEDRIRELEHRTSSTSTSTSSKGAYAVGGAALGAAAGVMAAPSIEGRASEHGSIEEEVGFLQTQVEMLTEELKSQQEASVTLKGEMEVINTKYKAALAEVHDLTGQLKETQMLGAETPDEREFLTPGESPTLSRRGSYNFATAGAQRNRGRPESLLMDKSPGRRKSLSRRSSGSFLGYNPKESTPRDGTGTPTTTTAQTALPSLQIAAAGIQSANGSPTLFRTRSLSQSLESDMPLGGRRKLSLSGSADFAKLGFAPEPRTPVGMSNGAALPSPNSLQSPVQYERKLASLEAETLRLQEVLRERDEEIAALEREAPKRGAMGTTTKTAASAQPPVAFPVHATRGVGDEEASSVDELMRVMARKETEARQQVEELMAQMTKLSKEKEASQSILENQLSSLVREVESLQQRETQRTAELEEAREKLQQEKEAGAKQHEEALKGIHLAHAKSVEEAEKLHTTTREALVAEHQKKLKEALVQARGTQEEEHSAKMKAIQEEHATMLSSLQTQHSEALASAEDAARQKHIASLGATEAEAAQRHEEERQALVERQAEQLQSLKDAHQQSMDAGYALLRQEHASKLEELEKQHGEKLASVQDQQTRALEEHKGMYADAIVKHEAALALLRTQHGEQVDGARQEHTQALDSLRGEHAAAVTKVAGEHENALAKLTDEHRQALQELEGKHAQAVQTLNSEKQDMTKDLERMQQNHLHTLEQLETLKTAHSEKLRSLTSEHSLRSKELQKSLDEAVSTRDALAATHDDLQNRFNRLSSQDSHDMDALRAELSETNDALVTLEGALTEAQEERDRLKAELEAAAAAASKSREAPTTEVKGPAQTQKELELLQTNLANVRSELQRSKSDIQGMLEDKTRQESSLREMQIRLTIAETRSAANTNRGGNSAAPPSPLPSDQATNGSDGTAASRLSPMRRESTDTEAGRSMRSLAPSSTAKPPPLTPPPSMPPPPTPSSNGAVTPTQQNSSRNSAGLRSSTSSSSLLHHNQPDSPTGGLTRSPSSTSVSTQSLNGLPPSAAGDAKTAKVLNDQAEEIKSLARQLNHCEMDLQANIDLVATLEAALNDSERNLRKSRLQLSEATRERDRYSTQVDELRSQVAQAQQETNSVRNSVMLEKQGYESKLQMEREAKDKARRALEARLDEVQKKKNGKLFCM